MKFTIIRIQLPVVAAVLLPVWWNTMTVVEAWSSRSTFRVRQDTTLSPEATCCHERFQSVASYAHRPHNRYRRHHYHHHYRMYVSRNPNNEDDQEKESTNATAVPLPRNTEQFVSWYLPPLLTILAFFTYHGTKDVFHTFIDLASGHTWVSADGGKFMAEMVRPVLNGPVTLSISILFGTLVATTVGTLFNRQIRLRETVISAEEQVQHLHLLVHGFPEPYRQRAKKLLRDYVNKVTNDFDRHQVTQDTLSHPELDSLVLLVNRLVKDPRCKDEDCPGAIIGEVYAGINAMTALRSTFRSTLQQVFAPAHYVNMVTLASTILFVFLLETDQNAMQYLLGFQLSICWSLLIGTYSLLAVVIYDLSTPFTGDFNIWNHHEVSRQSTDITSRSFLDPLEEVEKDDDERNEIVSTYKSVK